MMSRYTCKVHCRCIWVNLCITDSCLFGCIQYICVFFLYTLISSPCMRWCNAHHFTQTHGCTHTHAHAHSHNALTYTYHALTYTYHALPCIHIHIYTYSHTHMHIHALITYRTCLRRSRWLRPQSWYLEEMLRCPVSRDCSGTSRGSRGGNSRRTTPCGDQTLLLPWNPWISEHLRSKWCRRPNEMKVYIELMLDWCLIDYLIDAWLITWLMLDWCLISCLPLLVHACRLLNVCCSPVGCIWG